MNAKSKSKRKRNDSIDDNDPTTSLKSAKSRSRRQASNASKTNAFSVEEKKQFLLALIENGVSVVNDLDKLKQYLKKRTVSEIRSLVDNYTRKNQCKTIVEIEKQENDCYIGDWMTILRKVMTPNDQKNDFSQIFCQIVDDFGKQYESAESSDPDINYGEVYKYLATALNGHLPPKLKAKEASVVCFLLNDILNIVKSTDCDTEVAYLNGGSWLCNEDNVTNGVVKQENPFSCARSNETSEEEEIESDLDPKDDPKSYLNVPKIRKIGDCLNPLKIPISMLCKEHEELSLKTEQQERALRLYKVNHL